MSSLGDVVHTLPALTLLRRHLPEARINWLVEEAFAEIVQGHVALNRALVWRRREWVRLMTSGRWIAATRLIGGFFREVRDTRYDLIIDFQGLLKSALWVAAARGRRKAGYGPGGLRDEKGYLVLNERVTVTDPNAHAVERNLRLLEGLGFGRLPLVYDFPIAQENVSEAGALLEGAGLKTGQPLVVINAMTRWPTKNWTPEGFATVADGIAGRGGIAVFTGSTEDRPALDRIARLMRTPCQRLDGRTGLKTLAAVFRRAQVVLSADTGPLHIAVAVGTPVVGLFGPTSPEYTGPHGDRNEVLRVGISCSPCFKRVCETTRYEKHACMIRLSPEMVIGAVMSKVNDAVVERARL